ncbi:MAG: DUF433 domain-containing protein [Armatimonadetes bacterium]|nr:DUF433 domain-containing protein [Armatimonadota bacterium]
MDDDWQPPNRLVVQLGLGSSGLRGPAEGQLEPRLTVDPEVLDGQLCVRHNPVAVADVLQRLATGAGPDELLREFPGLEPADVRACLIYAALLAESAWPVEEPPPLETDDEPEEWLVRIRRRADSLWEATCEALPGWRIVADNPDIVLAGLRDAEAIQAQWAARGGDAPRA